MKNRKLSLKLFSALFVLGGVVWLSESGVMATPPETGSNYAEVQKEEPRARMKDEQAGDRIDAKATLRKATDLYAAIVKGKHGQVPESVLAKAQCITVIPDVITGALIVGGSHGVGIASCRENNTWSQPAFLKLNAVSFGAQIGGKSTDLVLFMVNPQAKAALKAGKITLGSDVSVAAGTFDRSLDTSTHGVIAYTRTEGAFAGASIAGGTISSDDDNTAAFYGKDVKYASLLEGTTRTEQNDLADSFIKLLPR